MKETLRSFFSAVNPIPLIRRLGFRRIAYITEIMTPREQIIASILVLLFFISGVALAGRAYYGITVSEPAVGGSYTEGILREPRTTNPILLSTNDTERDISRLVYSRLLAYDGEGNIYPDLADTYTVSEDGKEYTVTLKKNIYWHDGKPLTSDDVVFTINMIQDPKYKSPLRGNWQGVEVEKVDLLTVTFTLRSSYAPFIENLAVGIIPEHLWASINPEQIALHELNLHPIGSGPYRFKAFTVGKDASISQYHLVRNAKYYASGPFISDIYFNFYKSEDDIISAWRKGNIDGFAPLSEIYLPSFDPNAFTLNTIQMPRIFALFFNQKHAPILADSAVRTAIARAIDRETIVKKILFGATPQEYPLPSHKGGGENEVLPGVPRYDFDIDAANASLDKVGWKEKDENGIRQKIKIVTENKVKKEVATKLSFTLTTSDWPELVAAAQEIKKNLAKVGVGIEINSKPFLELESSSLRPRDFDMLLFGQVYGYEEDPFAFWHSSQIKDPGLNITLYSNKKADTLLQEARRTQDAVVREDDYLELQKQIMTDLPAVFLFSQLYSYLLPNSINGVLLSKVSLPSDRFNRVTEWYRRTTRVLK